MGENPRKSGRDGTCLNNTSSVFVSYFEKFFYRLGIIITRKPWFFIVGCVIFTATCSNGLFNFTAENAPMKLWIPQDSGFVENTNWLNDNFPNDIRFHSMIYEGDNLLNPEFLGWMAAVHKNISKLRTENGHILSDVCFKIPVIDGLSTRSRSKRQFIEKELKFDEDAKDEFEVPNLELEFDNFGDTFDDTVYGLDPNFEPTFDLSPDVFCDYMDNLQETCFGNNILEIWNYDESIISKLSQQDIIHDINKPSPNSLTNYSTLLGQIKKNDKGEIYSAGAILVQFFTRVNYSSIVGGQMSNDVGTGDIVDAIGLEWEGEFVDYMKSVQANTPLGTRLYFMASRSFGDISNATIYGDVRYLVAGTMILFIYVQLMLGKFNMVEQRAFLSMMGIGSVAMAIFVSYGICSAFGVPYGPVHSILPFLLLGIGIDDMFVIVQCWNNLTSEDIKNPLHVRIGTALKHAGVSITITSITDFAAFAVGSSTVLPSLKSFCIYSAVGILATYIFQATFFVAWLSLDQKRIESHRDGIIPCYVHRSWKPNIFSQIEPLQRFFTLYLAKYLFLKPVKFLILVLTATSLALNTWGSVLMRQEFNPLWFIPSSTYLSQYFSQLDHYFPNNGEMATVYIKTENLFNHTRELDDLITALRNETEIISRVDDWFTGFKEMAKKRYSMDLSTKVLSSASFHAYLKNYLFTMKGAKFRSNFKFSDDLRCLSSTSPDIVVSSFHMVFKPFSGREEHIPAMTKIKNLCKDFSVRFGGHVFPWARIFASWETDEVIMEELYRNLIIAMICVFCTTVILISNVYSCLLVMLCVLLTLICVNGSMHFWGLTIDTVSCINLVLAIGLCVDYAAHIGHTFMTKKGTRDERASATVASIGPAVFHGGFSTFLAFIFLGGSDSHVFMTFFKIFILVVGYGLFHGLIFLPVVLSLMGPSPFAVADIQNEVAADPEELEPQLDKESLPAEIEVVELNICPQISQSKEDVCSEDLNV